MSLAVRNMLKLGLNMSQLDRLGAFWVCVLTERHRETLAEGQLRHTGLEVYCPRYQRRVSSGRRRQFVARPLFPKVGRCRNS